MIETEEQRRWWFATHPEYSWSRRGNKHHEREQEKDKGSTEFTPEDVDAYVDRGLQFLSGAVADLLKSVKKHFGSEADSWNAWRILLQSEDIWMNPQGYYADGGAFMPRLPTTEELTRWPKAIAKDFFRWLDTVLHDNPLLVDPNALERHHGLPTQFIEYFMDCKLNIDDFIIILRAADHRLKPGGLHTGKGQGGDWNTEWEQFIAENPLTYTPKDAERVEKKLKEMKKKYGVDKKAVLLPARPKRR